MSFFDEVNFRFAKDHCLNAERHLCQGDYHVAPREVYDGVTELNGYA